MNKPTEQHEFQGKLKRQRSVRKQRAKKQLERSRAFAADKLAITAQELQNAAKLLLEVRSQLKVAPQPDLFQELEQHGAVVVLSDDPYEIDVEGLVPVPHGAEAPDDYDAAEELLLDCYAVPVEVCFNFKACGYKLRDRKKLEAEEPLKAVLKATGQLSFPVEHVSNYTSLDDWLDHIEDPLQDVDVDYDHHEPSAAYGTGYARTSVHVVKFREGQYKFPATDVDRVLDLVNSAEFGREYDEKVKKQDEEWLAWEKANRPKSPVN